MPYSVENVISSTGQTTLVNGTQVMSATSTGVSVAQAGPMTATSTPVTNAMSPYTVLSTDLVLMCATSGGAIAVVLPTAASSANRVIRVVDASGSAASNNVTITVSGGGNISGSASYVINSAYGAVGLMTNGSTWFVTDRVAATASSSALTLVETKTFSSSSTATFTGLNGDADLVYIMEGELTVAGSGTFIEILYNASSSAMQCTYIQTNSSSGTPVTGNASNLRFPFSGGISPSERLFWWCRIDCARGSTLGKTSFQLTTNQAGSSTPPNAIQQQIGAIFQTAANLTSLQVTNVSGNALTGQVSLYKLSRT